MLHKGIYLKKIQRIVGFQRWNLEKGWCLVSREQHEQLEKYIYLDKARVLLWLEKSG